MSQFFGLTAPSYGAPCTHPPGQRCASHTLDYLAELWKHPVRLLTSDEQGNDTTLTARPPD